MKPDFLWLLWGKAAQRKGRLRCWLAIGFSLGLVACDSGPKPADRKSGPAVFSGPLRKVQTARVAERRIERTVVALGSLLAYEQATVSAKVSGRVQELRVDIGSRVKRGDILAVMDPIDYELKIQQATAALSQARAALGLPLSGESEKINPEEITSVKEAKAVLDEAKLNHERAKNLAKEKLIPDSELDAAQSAYLVAFNRYQEAMEAVRQKEAMVAQRRAELAIAQQQLTETTLTAPFDGGIQARQASVGEYLTVGAPILTLVRLDPLRLRVEVSERDAPQVQLGQVVRFAVEGVTNVFASKVQRLSPALTDSRMLVVEADIPHDERLHPGYFTRAEIVTLSDAPALTIPTNALVTFSGLEKAFTIREGKAVEKRVSTRKRAANWIEVAAGLEPGEEIILNPGNLQNGNPVVIGPADLEVSNTKRSAPGAVRPN